MLAFHNDPAAKSDDLIQRALAAGAWSVDTLRGIVRSNRFRDRRVVGGRNTKGYLVATLHFDGARKQVKLHRVVWIAARGAIPDGLVPDHLNRDKADNRIANLRLVTNAENARNRRSYAGSSNPSARLTRETVDAIRKAAGSYAARAKRFGVSKSLVAQISGGELWA